MEQANSAEVVTPQQSVKGLSFKGIVQVFYQPAAFFQQLRNEPKVLVPYILLAILFTIFFVSLADLFLQMQLESPQLQAQLQGQPPTEQIKQILKMQTMIGGPIFLLLMPLVAAALAALVGNFFMGHKARFKQILSVMLYASVIPAVGSLLLIPMMLAKGSALVSFSLGVLAAGQGPDSILYVALSKIDLFIIWEIIAAGIGLAAIYGIPRNKGYVISVLSVGMLSILHVVFTAIGKAIF
ncbi:MAG: YIP1 family protein [Candidatus Zixiibacteriota bacterium]|nr:MAG: YIP1 family protein [candidate division Zixibacteria bacterium]